MTQDEIIELAMKSGLPSKEAAQHQLWWLEAFAKLVEERTVAKEREVCAKVCEAVGTDSMGYGCARLIRARGEA